MTSSSHDWLPDHHLSVAATLAHADEVIAQAADILFEYQTQPEGIIRLCEVLMVTHSQTVVTGMAPIPRKVPLLVADALVTLRNAIEHTLSAEVEHRDGALGEKAAKLVEMPARQTYDDFQTWVKGRTKNGPPSLQHGSQLLRRIDGLQPFHRTKDPQNHPLALLALHTNHSKHRAPAITAVGLAGIHVRTGLRRPWLTSSAVRRRRCRWAMSSRKLRVVFRSRWPFSRPSGSTDPALTAGRC